jgi:hypothetical protein
MKLILLEAVIAALFLTAAIQAQTTTTYTFPAGQPWHGSIYTADRDRLETGFPWTQFDFVNGSDGYFCDNTGAGAPMRTQVPEQLGPPGTTTGTKFTLTCSGMGINGVAGPFSLVTTWHAWSTVIYYSCGGKGGGRLCHTTVWTIEDSPVDGTPSNVAITH